MSMKSNNADLFFFEELNRTVGREQSFQWLLSQATKSVNNSPTRSPARSPCRSPHVSPPSSPRGRPVEAANPPPRKYVVPEGGGIRRSKNSFCRNDTSMSTMVDEELRSTSSSPNSPCLSANDFSHSFNGLDLKRLPVSCGAGDGKLGLLFTDAAHSVLD
jgi:hypothetical protein